jgi:hypothetical protein
LHCPESVGHVYRTTVRFREGRPASPGRGCVKTQNLFPRFRFWRFLSKIFAQNRATIDLVALFYAAKLVVTSFYTASAKTGPSDYKNDCRKAAFGDLR